MEAIQLAAFVSRNDWFISKAPSVSQPGQFDYFVSIFGRDRLRSDFEIACVPASNEGREPPLALTPYAYQIMMDGEQGFKTKLMNADQILSGVRRYMLTESGVPVCEPSEQEANIAAFDTTFRRGGR